MKKFLCLFFLLNSSLYASCYDTLYSETLTFIKKHEGFSSCEYTIEGVRTIGYGHVIKKGETFSCLTKEEATDLLKKNFKSAISIVKRYLTLTGSRLLAIAHFVYCKGIGTFLKSEIYSKLKSNLELKQEDFTKYRFPENRKWEWKLWTLNCT